MFASRDCDYEVHIIKGAKVPCVLARSKDGTLRVVGEAYLQRVYGRKVCVGRDEG